MCQNDKPIRLNIVHLIGSLLQVRRQSKHKNPGSFVFRVGIGKHQLGNAIHPSKIGPILVYSFSSINIYGYRH